MLDLKLRKTTPGSGSGGGTTTKPPTFGGKPGSVPIPYTPPPFRDGYTVTGALTLNDLASFKPIPGTDHMEPNGWAVTGLDTNFYAVTSTHVVDGTLLNKPAQVRFTPVRFRWNYGDGTSAAFATRGNTWAAQNITPFDPTPTSHIFTKAGNYTITLTIDFSAAYRYDSGDWIPVTGTLAIPANPLKVRVGGAKTVLVARNCLQDASGPGC